MDEEHRASGRLPRKAVLLSGVGVQTGTGDSTGVVAGSSECLSHLGALTCAALALWCAFWTLQEWAQNSSLTVRQRQTVSDLKGFNQNKHCFNTIAFIYSIDQSAHHSPSTSVNDQMPKLRPNIHPIQ